MLTEFVDEDIRNFAIAELDMNFTKWPQAVRDELLNVLMKGSGGIQAASFHSFIVAKLPLQ